MDISIVTSFNNKYARYAYVMLKSLLCNNPSNKISVFVLEYGLDYQYKNDLRLLFDEYESQVSFLEVDIDEFDDRWKVTEAWSIEAYYRLQMADLLPISVHKVMYLDVDTIVQQPLDEVFSFDISDTEVMAAKDDSQYPFGDERDELFGEICAEGYQYFCSGVMMFNMDLIRERYSFQSYIDTADAVGFKLHSPDQDILNLKHHGSVGYFDGNKYGAYARQMYKRGLNYATVKENVAIIHYTSDKPWQGQYIHNEIEQIWWDYAQDTPYYFDFLEEYMESAIMDPTIYNGMMESLIQKQELCDQLLQTEQLCREVLELMGKQ